MSLRLALVLLLAALTAFGSVPKVLRSQVDVSPLEEVRIEGHPEAPGATALAAHIGIASRNRSIAEVHAFAATQNKICREDRLSLGTVLSTWGGVKGPAHLIGLSGPTHTCLGLY